MIGRLYRPSEVAELFSICTRQMYVLIKTGQIEAIQVGGSRCTRISEQAIGEFLERQKIPKPRALRAVVRR